MLWTQTTDEFLHVWRDGLTLKAAIALAKKIAKSTPCKTVVQFYVIGKGWEERERFGYNGPGNL